MDTGPIDLQHLTPENVGTRRDEIFKAVRKPDCLAGWSLEREPALARVRLWIREAVRPGSDLAQLYRELAPDLDLEDDILESLPAFDQTPCFGPCAAHYSLRMLWRVLLRRYAIKKSDAVAAKLAQYEEDEPAWRRWRWKDRLFPRLAVGVSLGFFILGSSSGVVDTIYRLRFYWWWPATVAASVAVVYLLAVAQVQRQVGRLPIREIRSRAWRIVRFGALYAALGAGLQWLRMCLLRYGAPDYWPIAAMCGGVALLLGFVFQLFWQDRSIGEPL
jgi:hypothetical protein